MRGRRALRFSARYGDAIGILAVGIARRGCPSANSVREFELAVIGIRWNWRIRLKSDCAKMRSDEKELEQAQLASARAPFPAVALGAEALRVAVRVLASIRDADDVIELRRARIQCAAESPRCPPPALLASPAVTGEHDHRVDLLPLHVTPTAAGDVDAVAGPARAGDGAELLVGAGLCEWLLAFFAVQVSAFRLSLRLKSPPIAPRTAIQRLTAGEHRAAGTAARTLGFSPPDLNGLAPSCDRLFSGTRSSRYLILPVLEASAPRGGLAKPMARRARPAAQGRPTLRSLLNLGGAIDAVEGRHMRID